MIVAIEGFDQAGKTTQSRMLKKGLDKRGFSSIVFSFPDYNTQIGKQIKQYLNRTRKNPVPQVIHCLLSANRWEKLHNIQESQKEYDVLIMNRYIQSNLVYGAVNGLDKKWLANLDHGLPKADLVIVLDISRSDSFSRKKKKRDKFEKNQEFATKVTDTYKLFAKRFGWRTVDASYSKEEVHERVIEIVSNRLHKLQYRNEKTRPRNS